MHHVRLFTGCISLVRALCFPCSAPTPRTAYKSARGWCEPKVLLWLPCRLLCDHHGRHLCHETLTARNLLTFACHWSFVAPLGMTPVRFVSPECFASSIQIHSQTAAKRGRLQRLPGQVSQGPLLSTHRLLHAIPDRYYVEWHHPPWKTLKVTGFHIVGWANLLANITRSKQHFCWRSSHRFLNLGHWKNTIRHGKNPLFVLIGQARLTARLLAFLELWP